MHLPLVVPSDDLLSSTDGKEQTNHRARPTTGIKVAAVGNAGDPESMTGMTKKWEVPEII
jgi:hypothetical protein